jgi:hypothetical protein
LEAGFGPRVSDEARGRLQSALEAAGIDFIEENGGGLGVRFRGSVVKVPIVLSTACAGFCKSAPLLAARGNS